MNGTLCIRGTKQDYDDWNMPGWSGEEVFGYMKKAENFHGKDWFKADTKAHGYDGLLNIEPHDMVNGKIEDVGNIANNTCSGSNLQYDPRIYGVARSTIPARHVHYW